MTITCGTSANTSGRLQRHARGLDEHGLAGFILTNGENFIKS